jgi:hypothetical protein
MVARYHKTDHKEKIKGRMRTIYIKHNSNKKYIRRASGRYESVKQKGGTKPQQVRFDEIAAAIVVSDKTIYAIDNNDISKNTHDSIKNIILAKQDNSSEAEYDFDDTLPIGLRIIDGGYLKKNTEEFLEGKLGVRSQYAISFCLDIGNPQINGGGRRRKLYRKLVGGVGGVGDAGGTQPRIKGIFNIGNSCFINTALQLLFQLEDDGLFQGVDENGGLYQQFKNLYNGDTPNEIFCETNIVPFGNSLGIQKEEPQYNQEDTHEVMIKFFEKLDNISVNNRLCIQIKETIKYKETNADNIIYKCNEKINIQEPDYFLKIEEINMGTDQNIINIQEYVDKYIKGYDSKKGDTSFNCIAGSYINDVFTKYIKMTLDGNKNYILDTSPEFMLIHLVGNNISDFNFNVPKTFNKSQYIYILQGVCVFSGTIGVHSSKKGHYVYLGKRNDVWYYFNDEHYAGTVSDYKTGHYNDKRKNLFDIEENFIIFKETFTPYVLYYKRTGGPDTTPNTSSASGNSTIGTQPKLFKYFDFKKEEQKKFLKLYTDSTMIFWEAIPQEPPQNGAGRKKKKQKGGKNKEYNKWEITDIQISYNNALANTIALFNAAKALYDCYSFKEGKNIYIRGQIPVSNGNPDTYAFPEWVINRNREAYGTDEDHKPYTFDRFKFNETVVLYDKDDKIEEVFNTVFKRDPVNVTMNRLFNPDTLKGTFGYNQAYYLDGFYTTEEKDVGKSNDYEFAKKTKKTKKTNSSLTLKPNIAIYCKALVNCRKGDKWNKSTETTWNTVQVDLYNVEVHVMNLIGYGFDTQEQPDYIYIASLPINERKSKIIELYRKMWLKLAVFCVQNKGTIKHVIISNVGGNNFARYYLDAIYGNDNPENKYLNSYKNNFLNEIFKPSFGYENTDEMNTSDGKNLANPCKLMTDNGIIVIVEITTDDINTKLRIPNIIYVLSVKQDGDNASKQRHQKGVVEQNPTETLPDTATLDNTLFVNAWDPHSIIGNGNYNDDSLDGFWGRISNMSVLGWGYTNPYMKWQAIKFDEIKTTIGEAPQATPSPQATQATQAIAVPATSSTNNNLQLFGSVLSTMTGSKPNTTHQQTPLHISGWNNKPETMQVIKYNNYTREHLSTDKKYIILTFYTKILTNIDIGAQLGNYIKSTIKEAIAKIQDSIRAYGNNFFENMKKSS